MYFLGLGITQKSYPNPLVTRARASLRARARNERVAGRQGSRPHIFFPSTALVAARHIPLAIPCCQHCNDVPCVGGDCRAGGSWRGGKLKRERASEPRRVPISFFYLRLHRWQHPPRRLPPDVPRHSSIESTRRWTAWCASTNSPEYWKMIFTTWWGLGDVWCPYEKYTARLRFQGALPPETNCNYASRPHHRHKQCAVGRGCTRVFYGRIRALLSSEISLFT